MIEKINQLKSKTASNDVKTLCEAALTGLTSATYNAVTPEARHEIERVTISNLFEGLSKIEDKETKTWLANQKRAWAVKNLGVRESINQLLQTEAKDNGGLKITLDRYRESIENGISEVRIYESFISAMQSFSYFPQVGNAIKAIQDNVENYKSDVSIKKILETMKETRSNYLLPIIEDVVQNYLDNKTEQTKSSMKESLIKFSYDPFVRDLINLVSLDATELQLEHANGTCDIEKVYSPVLYLGENEAIFAVKGLYYVKKGNIVTRLGEKEVKRIDPEFLQLCEAINNPNVVITGKNISVYEGKDKAVITEAKVNINGKDISSKEFAESVDVAHWTGKGNFLALVETLRRNFNEIAEVDFAKRVFLKENENYAADVFKLRGNVFIATHNPNDGKSTFYRNINPIQAKEIMMEHLRYDVSRLFEGLLPEEEKILDEIEQTKLEYREYLTLLEEKIASFKKELPTPVVNKVIEALNEEYTEVNNEYVDYLNVAEKYVRPLGEAITVTVDVDGKKYTVPIPADGGQPAAQNQSGSQPGQEEIEKQPASAVTFQDDKTELLGDTPTIASDSVAMGSDEIGAEADKAEADAKKKEKEGEGENGQEEATDLEGGEEDEVKIEDKTDADSEEEEVNPEEEDEEKEKTEESAEGSEEIKKVKPEEKKPKRRVFLVKK